jgi:hypothetical protein
MNVMLTCTLTGLFHLSVKGLKVCVHIHKNRIEKASRFYYSRPFTT